MSFCITFAVCVAVCRWLRATNTTRDVLDDHSKWRGSFFRILTRFSFRFRFRFRFLSHSTNTWQNVLSSLALAVPVIQLSNIDMRCEMCLIATSPWESHYLRAVQAQEPKKHFLLPFYTRERRITWVEFPRLALRQAHVCTLKEAFRTLSISMQFTHDRVTVWQPNVNVTPWGKNLSGYV